MCGILKKSDKMSTCNSKFIIEWSPETVAEWLEEKGHSKYVNLLCYQHNIDGKALLLLTECDLKSPPLSIEVQ